MSSVNLYPNGFLVKRIDSEDAKKYGQYKGIEGDCWPINEYSSIDEIEISAEEGKYLSKFLKDNILLNDFDNSYVDVCPNIFFLKRYIKACQDAGYRIQVIFVKLKKNFLNAMLIQIAIINLLVTIMVILAAVIILAYSMT